MTLKLKPSHNLYLTHSLLTESKPQPKSNTTTQKNSKNPSTTLSPTLQLSLSDNLQLNFSDKTLDLLLDKSKSVFKDTFKTTSLKDPEKFLDQFKDNLSQSIQKEHLLNYFNLLIPSLHIQTQPNSPIKNLILDFNLNHNQETHDNQIGFKLKGQF